MADYDWFDHTPSESDKLAAEWRAQGMHPVADGHMIGGQILRIKYYKCQRGCGTIVWDPEAHVMNVCIEFKPVVGKVQAQASVERAPKVIHLDHPDGAICGGTGWTTRIQENVSCDVCRRLIEELKL